MTSEEKQFHSLFKEQGFRKKYKNCILSYQKRGEQFYVIEKAISFNNDIGYFDNIFDAIEAIEENYLREPCLLAPKRRNAPIPKWVLKAKEIQNQ